MSLSMIQTLEAMRWGPYIELTTPNGPKKLKEMKNPPADFWNLWKNPPIQLQMKRNGYDLRKVDGTWIAYRWVEIVQAKRKEELLKESMAEELEISLLRPAGIDYRPFQRAGIKYCMDRLFGMNGFAPQKSILLGDDMGLGKTVQGIGIMNQDPELRNIRALVICPASLKLNWRDEMRKWMMDGMGYEAFVVKDKWPGGLNMPRFVIVNYDLLHKFEHEIRNQEWDYVLIDEAHYLKSKKSRRTIYAMGGIQILKKDEREIAKVVEPIPTKYEIFMTGTPIPNQVKEGWTIFERIDPEGVGKNFQHFVKRYCSTDDNLEELQTRLRLRGMVRRAKSAVLKELPPKQRQVITLDPDDLGCSRLFKQEMSIFKEYQELLQTWQVKTELAKAQGIQIYRKTLAEKKQKLGMQASELAKLRMSTALAKIPAVIEQVAALVREGKRVILFAHHLEVIDKLKEGLEAAKISLVKVDGRTTLNDRHEAVKKFQEGNTDVFLGGIIPAGVGLTLTAADTVVFCELDWVPGNMTQAEDRAHRMGQLLIVWIMHMVMEGSLDEYIAKKLIQKQERIERALDSKCLSEEDQDDETDHDEAREGILVKESAASKGVSAEKLQQESEKLTDEMISAISTALSTILKVNNKVDQEILDSLRTLKDNGTVTKLQLALARKILFRRREELPEDVAKALEWEKREAA